MVEGSEIPIADTENLSQCFNQNNQVQGNQWAEMDSEVTKLLKLGVIEESAHEEEVVCLVSLVNKADSSFHVILNLKQFNESVEFGHFKMDNLS